ncbi:MAG TPA: DUF4388 domain-containing protein, partial [Minicystis sp.]|nr:DUF4388 domain-containing protein [Minicystis sp.]
ETRATPLLLLAPRIDARSSLAAFFATADVCLQKPVGLEEAVGQVGALVRMRARLAPSRAEPALRGDLAQVSAATVLQILDVEQRTGDLRVDVGDRRVLVELASGCAVRASIDGEAVTLEHALAAMLEARRGSFAFAPRAPRMAPPSAARIGRLLIAAAGDASDDAAR